MYGHVRKMQLDNGVEAWDFGSYQYLNAAVKNFQYYIRKNEIWNLPDKDDTPIKTTYWPEVDTNNEIHPTE